MQKMIANVLNSDNEGYSNLKQIVKENVKAVLSNNKILLSASFAAVIQILKTDPQMVKLIYNIGARRPVADNTKMTTIISSNTLNLIRMPY
jgi:hypothetical protein